MKATKRAKRLEKFLREQLEWVTATDGLDRNCPSGHKVRCGGKFCPECGKKTTIPKGNDEELFIDLERAIAYALKE